MILQQAATGMEDGANSGTTTQTLVDFLLLSRRITRSQPRQVGKPNPSKVVKDLCRSLAIFFIMEAW